jgi:uncharacterized Zn-finger protein
MELLDLIESEPATRPYKCDWESCPKSFYRKADLERHYQVLHINEHPYACNTPGCDKRFIQRSALTVHMQTHRNLKPYQCQHCEKCFTTVSSNLNPLSTHKVY